MEQGNSVMVNASRIQPRPCIYDQVYFSATILSFQMIVVRFRLDMCAYDNYAMNSRASCSIPSDAI